MPCRPALSRSAARARVAARLKKVGVAAVHRPAPPSMNDPGLSATPSSDLCQGCGACCAYSRDWPRFTTEDDDALALIPPEFVADDDRGMRCHGERCAALDGVVGVSTSCTLYAVRPDVCRACEPGDEACRMARERFGMRPLPSP